MFKTKIKIIFIVYFIFRNANSSIMNKEIHTPLISAAIRGNYECFEALYTRGVSITDVDATRRNVIHIAAELKDNSVFLKVCFIVLVGFHCIGWVSLCGWGFRVCVKFIVWLEFHCVGKAFGYGFTEGVWFHSVGGVSYCRWVFTL